MTDDLDLSLENLNAEDLQFLHELVNEEDLANALGLAAKAYIYFRDSERERTKPARMRSWLKDLSGKIGEVIVAFEYEEEPEALNMLENELEDSDETEGFGSWRMKGGVMSAFGKMMDEALPHKEGKVPTVYLTEEELRVEWEDAPDSPLKFRVVCNEVEESKQLDIHEPASLVIAKLCADLSNVQAAILRVLSGLPSGRGRFKKYATRFLAERVAWELRKHGHEISSYQDNIYPIVLDTLLAAAGEDPDLQAQRGHHLAKEFFASEKESKK